MKNEGNMKRMTAEDLLALQYGDEVEFKGENANFTTTFRYVGRMPGSERCLILSSGENLKSLYVQENDEFKGDWYSGEYDDKFFIRLRIKELQSKINDLKLELVRQEASDQKLR